MTDEKYLDPDTNDFILVHEPEPGPEPPDLSFEPVRAPFATIAELTRGIDAAELTRKIAERYPGQEDLVVGGIHLTLMADNSYSEAGSARPLKDLSPATLAKIGEAL